LPRLSGVLLSGGNRSVIFAAPDGGRPTVVAEGGQVAGYTVQSIEPGRVTLAGPDGTRVLRPSFDPRAPIPNTTVGAAPAGDVLPILKNLPGLAGAVAPSAR